MPNITCLEEVQSNKKPSYKLSKNKKRSQHNFIFTKNSWKQIHENYARKAPRYRIFRHKLVVLFPLANFQSSKFEAAVKLLT
jgi:hypothetical protein